MNLLPSTGITIDTKIVDPNQHIYKKGRPHGFLRLEISVEQTDLAKVASAYAGHYSTLLKPSSVRKLPKKKSAHVSVILPLKAEAYQALLKKPPQQQAAWIPSGPVMDKSGSDIKLTGALLGAGFPIRFWTRQVHTLRLPKQTMRPLRPVKFLVQGKTWTLVSHTGMTQHAAPPAREPHG